MNKSEKSHDTGLRIIEVLKILLESDCNKQTIIEKLKSNGEISNAYTNEAYLKYFNTFEVLGLNIEKKNNEYCLKNALIGVDLTLNEEKLLIKLIKSISKLNNKNKEEILKKFISRLGKYVNLNLKDELKQIENKSYSDTLKVNMVNTLKQLLEDKSEVTITYKKRNGKEETIDAAIKKIMEEKGNYYVMCYNPSMLRNKRICVSSVMSVKRRPRLASDVESKSSVIYEVYGRLSKSYKIKSWETLNDFGEGYLRITNTKEDFDTLLHRLLKYGENCKIVQPANVINEFLSLTDDILNNLEENICPK